MIKHLSSDQLDALLRRVFRTISTFEDSFFSSFFPLSSSPSPSPSPSSSPSSMFYFTNGGPNNKSESASLVKTSSHSVLEQNDDMKDAIDILRSVAIAKGFFSNNLYLKKKKNSP